MNKIYKIKGVDWEEYAFSEAQRGNLKVEDSRDENVEGSPRAVNPNPP